jgi:hypothetical protein
MMRSLRFARTGSLESRIAHESLARAGGGTARNAKARFEQVTGFRVLVLMKRRRVRDRKSAQSVRRMVSHGDGPGNVIGGKRFGWNTAREFRAESQ